MVLKKIKVLQITSSDVTVKHLLLPLIDKLTEAGYQVESICSDGKYVEGLKSRGYSIASVDIGRRIAPISNLKSFLSIYKFIKKGNFDIVHTHSPVASMLGRIAAKMAGVPAVIHTAHGFYFHENMAKWKRRAFIWMEKILGRLFTDMLLTQSLEDKGTAISEGIIAKDKIEWISNGVDLNKFETDSISRDSLGISTRDKVVGFVGRLVAEKGIEELISAVAQAQKKITNIKLLIVGDTLESDRDQTVKQKIKKTVSDNDLDERIVFTGFTEDIAGMYGAMDVFVLPSYREGMPRSVLEAMASGKPVVATNIRGSREEVVDNVTGRLVPIKDPEALAGAIQDVLSDENTARSMGEAGLRRAREMFNEEKVLEKELGIYERLINEKLS